MPQAQYTVDFHEGVWNVILLERRFGPYSSMDTAMLAAMGAARKAEVMGYEATVVVQAQDDDADAPDNAGETSEVA